MLSGASVIVSTHSRLKAAGVSPDHVVDISIVSTHSRLKAAGHCPNNIPMATIVSTHSRLKAAGYRASVDFYGRHSFNTQPPEGGWDDGL